MPHNSRATREALSLGPRLQILRRGLRSVDCKAKREQHLIVCYSGSTMCSTCISSLNGRCVPELDTTSSICDSSKIDESLVDSTLQYQSRCECRTVLVYSKATELLL